MPVVNVFVPLLFALLAVGVAVLSRSYRCVVAGAVAMVLAALWLGWLVIRTGSAFMGVGLFFVPFFAGAYGLAVGAVCWAVAMLFARRHVTAAVAVLAIVLVFAGRYGWSEWIVFNVERGSYGAAQLRRLARGDDLFVLRAIARQRLTPPDALLALAKRREPELRRPPAGIRGLLRDANTAVLAEVAANPATPPEALQLLAREPVWRISEPAARSFEARVAMPAIARERAQGELVTAADPRTRRETLAVLAESADAAVRAAVARNRNTPPETLLRLATDPDASVRGAVNKPSSPP